MSRPKSRTTGVKHDAGKPPLELLPREALWRVAEVLGYGAQKYSKYNWRGGLEWTRVYGAVLRHLTAWADGEDLDGESGLSHLAHAGCGVCFLLQYSKDRPDLDDRYKTRK